MGILRLFKYYYDRYPNSIIELDNIQDEQKKLNIEFVGIDLNAIFHPCCQQAFKYGAFKPKTNLFGEIINKNNLSFTFEQTKKYAFNLVTKNIDMFLSYFKNIKVLYLAVDGVPGLSKQTQQRQRRFKNGLTQNDNQFDPNSLTVGTQFMEELCNYIRGYCKRKINFIDKIYFDGMNINGEGEHKIIRFLDQNTFKSVVIVSPDADMIMLSMTIKAQHIFVLRENIFIRNDFEHRYDKHYLLFNIQELKKYIYLEVGGDLDEQLVIIDYIFFLYFCGNDFLPNIPSLEINTDGIDLLINIYSKIVKNHGYLIEQVIKKVKNKEQISYKINKNNFKLLLEELCEYENMLLLKKTKIKCYENDTILLNNIYIKDDEEILNYINYRKEYYKINFGEEDIDVICNEYLRGMTFVLNYYLVGIPTFDWYYPYHYAPLISDLYQFISKNEIEYEFKFIHSLNMYESLFGTIPQNSFNLLPENIYKVVNKYKNIDNDFPTKFEIDYRGKKNEFEGICLIPNLSYEKIKNIFKNVEYTEEQNNKIHITNINLYKKKI